jgi:hypothetical protein
VRLPQTSYSLGQSTIRQIEEPKLFLAGRFDDEAARAVRHWLAWAGAPKAGKILDTGLHGTDMINLASGEDADMPGIVKRSVFRFLAQYAPPGHA